MRKIVLAALAALALFCPDAHAQAGLRQIYEYQPVVAKSVGTSALALISAVQGRTVLYVRNTDVTKTLYLSFSASVATANGWPLPPGEWIEYDDVTPGQTLYGIATSGTIDARVQAVFHQ